MPAKPPPRRPQSKKGPVSRPRNAAAPDRPGPMSPMPQQEAMLRQAKIHGMTRKYPKGRMRRHASGAPMKHSAN